MYVHTKYISQQLDTPDKFLAHSPMIFIIMGRVCALSQTTFFERKLATPRVRIDMWRIYTYKRD